MVEFDGLPEDERNALQAKLAELRDDVPPVPFSKLERLLRDEFGGPLTRVFSEFDERAFAAASIGQVHRATTVDGDEVVVKVQYPGVAEAVETDLRNAMLLLPLVKRLAPGLDVRALASELRERISEELDYELEAQNQRRIERLRRGHPFISVPAVNTELSTRRALVSEFSASTSACCTATGSRSATLIPGTTSCSRTGASASSTTGCCAMPAPRASPPSGGLRVRSVPAMRRG
jgi:predicted unusual protein kinase regulating ubiquinone biosynthesis (AarF/ABC1/UbiB family)